jgi:hypothetical protein
MAIALWLVVRVGIPVAVLFAVSYWLERRHQSPMSNSDIALPEGSQIGHNETTDMRNGEEGVSNVAHEIRLDALAPLEMAGTPEDIGVRKASKDTPEALPQRSGPGVKVISLLRGGGSTK